MSRHVYAILTHCSRIGNHCHDMLFFFGRQRRRRRSWLVPCCSRLNCIVTTVLDHLLRMRRLCACRAKTVREVCGKCAGSVREVCAVNAQSMRKSAQLSRELVVNCVPLGRWTRIGTHWHALERLVCAYVAHSSRRVRESCPKI